MNKEENIQDDKPYQPLAFTGTCTHIIDDADTNKNMHTYMCTHPTTHTFVCIAYTYTHVKNIELDIFKTVSDNPSN